MNSYGPELLELFASEAASHLEVLKKERLSEKPDIQVLHLVFHAIRGWVAAIRLSESQKELACSEGLAQKIKAGNQDVFCVRYGSSGSLQGRLSRGSGMLLH